MKVTPSLPKGVAVLLGYLAVVFTVWIVTDVDYDTVGDSVENVRNAITLAMAAGAIYLVVVVSVLGWWKPALHEARRAHHGWMWILPVLLGLGIVVNLALTQWGRIDDLGTELGPYVAWLLVGSLMVGFNEEMVTRGQLIVGARGTLHEGWVWFTTALCFGLLHVPNALFGQSVAATAQQVLFAFGVGTAYYVIRRISGALAVTMALHGLWDFSTFIQTHSTDRMDDPPVAIGGLFMNVAVPIALIAVWRLHHDDGDVVEPGGDQLVAFEQVAT
jgi:membrane protease YdiL (CAAX protease family)